MRRRSAASSRFVSAVSSRMLRGVIVLSLLSGAAACGAGSVPPPEERTFVNTDDGYRFVVPPEWVAFADEVRSHNGTVFTVEILSLADADPDFLEGLPASILPQLEGRTRFYFSVVAEYRTSKIEVGGAPALEVHFPVRIRDIDPPTELIYWVVPRESRLFLLRATFPAGFIDTDGPGALSMIDTWEFL